MKFFSEGANYLEVPRNVFFEKMVDGSIRVVKYVGDPLNGGSVLYEYTYSADEWKSIGRAMSKAYVESLPEPDAVSGDQESLAGEGDDPVDEDADN